MQWISSSNGFVTLLPCFLSCFAWENIQFIRVSLQPEIGLLFVLSASLRLICVRQFETSLLHYINCLSCPWRKRFISVTITIYILRHSVEIVLMGSFYCSKKFPFPKNEFNLNKKFKEYFCEYRSSYISILLK